ncbi:protein kinase domain-containing protein [Arsenicicoccus dermatophilus]|uniref:protein kinase domain-containing protein n=1 Tax=Arsenicicoccus dermatophilus TaxID=1076331 RepID=UPI001F4CDE83|nr:serine/threonine-protein kinase [Arsenicicoccus dermatophilus]MCH8612005.1 serine/threonine protein kinase [Arsenicicoccus dermatophilus]
MSESSTQPGGPQPDDDAVGVDTIGPYRVVGRLGEGGMGVVHLGLDRVGRAVAIKVLRDHVAADPGARARLAREVATLGRVRHPRVAPVLDADPDGERPYVVTKYVPGPPLDDYVGKHGPLRGDELVSFAGNLVEALEAIHAAGVIHRDLKPGNVLVVDGAPVVIDFGIAHVADDVRLTSTGLVMGTPGYLAPEILAGAPVSESTDWWGWAATLAFAATGRSPFGSGRVDAVLDRVRHGRHDLSSVDVRLQPLLAAALAPEPAVRPAARTVVASLEQVVRGDTPLLGIGTSGRTELLPQQLGSRYAADRAAATASVAGRTLPVGPPTERVPPPSDPAHRSAVPPAPSSAQPAPSSAQPAPSSAQPAPSSAQSAASRAAATPPTSVMGSTAPQPAVSAAYTPSGIPGGTARPVAGPTNPPAARPDPDPERREEERPLSPARTAQLVGLVAALAALAAAWPLVALAVALTWSVLARTVDRSVTATVLRRHEAGGARGTDLVVAVVRSPFELVAATLSTLVTGLLGLLVVAASAFAATLVLRLGGAGDTVPTGAVPLAVGALAGSWTAWWGPKGLGLRRGSRVVMRALTPARRAGDVVTGVLVALAVALTIWTALRHGVPAWWPLPSDPTVQGSVPWQF